MDITWFIAQFIGFIAILFGINAFKQTSDLQFKKKMTLFCIIESVHFAVLMAWSASFGCLINGCRSFASIRTRSKWVMFVFLSVLWVVGIFSLLNFNIRTIQESYNSNGIFGILIVAMSNPIRILPLIGSTIGTVGLFLFSGIKLRVAVFMCSFLWLMHNLVVVSIGPSIMEMIFLFLNFKTIIKLANEKKKYRVYSQ